MRRLSVFANGATFPAVEAVCAGDGVGESEVLGLVVSLVDHSLVVVGHDRGGTRYRLLETIRSFGRHRLDEAGERERTQRRHARHLAQLAESGDERLRGPDQRAWLGRLDAEAADVRAALEWALPHDAGLALRLVGAMAWFWYLRGRQGEASRLLVRALGNAGEAPAPARAKALAWSGALGSLEPAVDDPVAHRRAALAGYAELDDPSGLAHAKLLLGGLLRPWAEVPEGGRLIEEALATFRNLDDRWGAAAARIAASAEAQLGREGSAIAFAAGSALGLPAALRRVGRASSAPFLAGLSGPSPRLAGGPPDERTGFDQQGC